MKMNILAIFLFLSVLNVFGTESKISIGISGGPNFTDLNYDKLSSDWESAEHQYNLNIFTLFEYKINQYIGSICHWKDCGPGIRTSCDAMHCGLRKYLHDDLGSVRLDSSLINDPLIVLWPEVKISGKIPDDLIKEIFDDKKIDVTYRGG